MTDAWDVVYVEEAVLERSWLPMSERTALRHAVEKLQVMGPRLGYPHASSVRGTLGLRELRPRAGRSRWRAIYSRVGDVFVVAAIGPEAECDRRGFDQSVRSAVTRLADVKED